YLIIKTTTRWSKPFWFLTNDGFYYIIGFYNLFSNLLIGHFCHIGMIKSVVTYKMSLFFYHLYYIFIFFCPFSFYKKYRFYFLFFLYILHISHMFFPSSNIYYNS